MDQKISVLIVEPGVALQTERKFFANKAQK